VPLDKKLQYAFAALLAIMALVLFGAALIGRSDATFGAGQFASSLIAALVLLFAAYSILTRQFFKSVSLGPGNLTVEYFEQLNTVSDLVPVRKLDKATIAEKESHAGEVRKEHTLPGEDAPRFSAISPTTTEDLLVRPSAYPMTPMYLLDNAFRILDWNEAFTVAFDRSMEGEVLTLLGIWRGASFA
jgi:hypothetical protein